MKSLFFIFLFLTISCGKSPFEKDTSSENDQSLGEFSSYITVSSSEDRSSRSDDNKNLKYKLNGVWEVGPNLEDENKLLFVILGENGERVSDLNLHIYIWMPTMGHGSFPISVVEIADGIYEFSEIFFTMPGLWDIHFQVLGKDEKILSEVKWSLTL